MSTMQFLVYNFRPVAAIMIADQ